MIFPDKLYKSPLTSDIPIEFSYLCLYGKGNYAIYINEITELPIKIHQSNIDAFFKDYKDCLLNIKQQLEESITFINQELETLHD